MLNFDDLIGIGELDVCENFKVSKYKPLWYVMYAGMNNRGAITHNQDQSSSRYL